MLILLGILVALALFTVVIFNRLVALRQSWKNAFADIDVQLKQRFDLVPNLVETVKGYATHESDIFLKVTEARAAVGRNINMAERGAAEAQLGVALTQLLAVAEAYPDLKANENFMGLQRELSDIENKIAAARRFMNSAVAEYNAAIEQFPAVILASAFGFTAAAMFEVPEAEREAVQQPPRVSFNK